MHYPPYNQPSYYTPSPPPPRRFPIERVLLFISLALVLLAGYAVFTALTAKPSPDGYMNTEDGPDGHALRYLHWDETNGVLSGYWSIAEVKGTAKPTYGGGTLTGTHNGTSISLTFFPNFGDGTSTGTLVNNVLTLQTPARDGSIDMLEFHGVTQKEYEQELSDWKKIWG